MQQVGEEITQFTQPKSEKSLSSAGLKGIFCQGAKNILRFFPE